MSIRATIAGVALLAIPLAIGCDYEPEASDNVPRWEHKDPLTSGSEFKVLEADTYFNDNVTYVRVQARVNLDVKEAVVECTVIQRKPNLGERKFKAIQRWPEVKKGDHTFNPSTGEMVILSTVDKCWMSGKIQR